jgi:hypothetical protein
MKVSMCYFVSQVFGNPVSPKRHHHQSRIILDEKRSAIWKGDQPRTNVGTKFCFILEQIDVDWLIRCRQLERLSNFTSQRYRTLNQSMMLRQVEVGMYRQLIPHLQSLAGQFRSRVQYTAAGQAEHKQKIKV